MDATSPAHKPAAADPLDAPLCSIARDQLLILERSLTREWLEVDGLGGYASSTVLGCPTRRQHGLLVAPRPGTTERHVFVSRLDEWVHGTEKAFSLSMARYPGTFAPQGHHAMAGFSLAPNPKSVFQIGRTCIERELLMVHGQPTTLVRYRADTPRDGLRLRLRPLLPFRPADALTFENLALNPRAQRLPRGFQCRPYESLPALHVTVGASGRDAGVRFEADPVWFRRIELVADLARGYPGHEDNFCPGELELALRSGEPVVVALTIGEPVADPLALWDREAAPRRAALRALDGARDVRSVLRATGAAFLQRTPRGRLGVCAGFPWFGEWGRDTFIALPGLTLAGQPDGPAACREVLHGALEFLHDGLLPNIFGTSRADSHYGSVDAALWFARAVRLYERSTGASREVATDFLPALTVIAEQYAAGTSPAMRALGIRADADFFIEAGVPGSNPTWMDACTGRGPVTPRHGAAVEIQALYYFLLEYLAELSAAAGDAAAAGAWRARSKRLGKAFLERLWIEDERYLADVWRDGERDVAVRPNMVVAAALEWSPLSRGKRTDVVERAAGVLLTPRGLRTLDPRHPDYVGRYAGGPADRDAAYHQGTVWPWLVGFYCEASLRAFGTAPKCVAALRALLDGFTGELECAGLGHVSEVFDGDPPHRPGGTIAQAWSTAEILRAYRMLDGGGP